MPGDFLRAVFYFLVLLLTMSDEVMSVRNVVFGLNPALQRTLTLTSRLTPGAVNRGAKVELGIGGKGQDVFIAAKSMGAELPVLAQFLGTGAEGDQLAGLLQELAGAEGVGELNQLTVRTSARLRNAITLLSPGPDDTTEIVEPSGSVSEEELEKMRAALTRSFGGGVGRGSPGIAVMGSMPPGCPALLYAELVKLCADKQSAVVLDVVSNVVPLLSALQGAVGTLVLKVNARELLGVVGMKTQGGSESSESSSSHVAAAAAALASQLVLSPSTATFVACTDGPFTAHLLRLSRGEDGRAAIESHTRFSLPPLPAPVVNPIGAGDAVASGTIMALSCKVALPTGALSSATATAKVEDAFRWGLACGAASCLTPSNSQFKRSDAEKVFAGIGTQKA
jgi:fructose-1-phosphate kinase PfkB-like protein